MPKISVSSLKPGMKLSKPVLNEAGMVLFAGGTELKNSHIERLASMNFGSVHIEGESGPKKSKEEMMFELDARFRKIVDEPNMGYLKRLFREHIEEKYK